MVKVAVVVGAAIAQAVVHGGRIVSAHLEPRTFHTSKGVVHHQRVLSRTCNGAGILPNSHE